MKKLLYLFLIVTIIISSMFCFNGCKANENKFGLMAVSEMSGGADKQAEKLKKEILSAPDTLKAKNEYNYVYYIAEDGIDWNDGLSPEKPTTLDVLYSLTLNKGDVVLFKRGDTFRLDKQLTPKHGVSYGAYGEGAKPLLLGSLKNYADETLWTGIDDNTKWKIHLGTSDAGQVIFNNGEFVGFRKHTLEEVTSNGDFYYDYSEKTLYLYLLNNNPGKCFDSIEIATTSRAFGGWGTTNNPVSNIRFENLCMKYFSLFAFNISYTDGIEINNCEIGFIGGEITASKRDRFGNAIQFWDHSNNAKVTNNYIYQIFDAAITFQGEESNQYTNLTFKNNLIEYCSMNFEFWAGNDQRATATSSDSTAKIHNIDFSDNILRFGGYGFGGLQRKIKKNQSFFLAWYYKYDDSQIEQFNIKNNIFDTADCNFFYAPNLLEQINISDNTYYQRSDSLFRIIRDSDDDCNDQKSFEEVIRKVDKNPKEVKWIN